MPDGAKFDFIKLNFAVLRFFASLENDKTAKLNVFSRKRCKNYTLTTKINYVTIKKKGGFPMKYCTNCGKEIDEKAVICVHCGCAVANQTPEVQNGNDTNPVLFGLLGALVPVAGLILFILWKNTSPKRAKAAGIGALIGWISGMMLGAVVGAFMGAMSYGLY